MWLLRDFVHHPHAVPNPVAIARPKMKRMRPRWYVGVNSVSGSAGVEPFRINAVQPILQTNLFRRRELDGVEMQLDMMRTWRKHKFVTGMPRGPANGDVLHINRRLSFRHGQTRKIQHGQSLRGRDPELAVTRKCRVGLANGGLCRFQSVGRTERCIVDRFILPMQSLETARRDSKNASSVEP